MLLGDWLEALRDILIWFVAHHVALHVLLFLSYLTTF
jgi:hypothetical protein